MLIRMLALTLVLTTAGLASISASAVGWSFGRYHPKVYSHSVPKEAFQRR